MQGGVAMKFLLFSDLHHYPDVFMSGSWEDLEVLQCRALEENCDFMMREIFVMVPEWYRIM